MVETQVTAEAIQIQNSYSFVKCRISGVLKDKCLKRFFFFILATTKHYIDIGEQTFLLPLVQNTVTTTLMGYSSQTAVQHKHF